jgi:hypothetical protein
MGVAPNEIKPSPVLLFPRMAWPTVCADQRCAHLSCNRWRDQALRRCHLCSERIAAGAQYREYRDPSTRQLVMQEHVSCPVKS